MANGRRTELAVARRSGVLAAIARGGMLVFLWADGAIAVPIRNGPALWFVLALGTMVASYTLHHIGSGVQTGAFTQPLATPACATYPLRSTGTIHYVCDCQAGAQGGCVAGSDTNNGLTPATPIQTWTAAVSAFNAMNAGDTVAFCKGGALAVAASGPGGNQVTNSLCAAGSNLQDPANTSTCDLRDYAPAWGGTAKPIIQMTAATQSYLINRYTASAPFSTNGVRILNLDIRGTSGGPGSGNYPPQIALAFNVFSTANDSDWLICNNSFSNHRIAIQLNAPSSGANRFTILSNRFVMLDQDAILGGMSNSSIDSNFMDNVGCTQPAPDGSAGGHVIYLSAKSNTNVSIVNNEIRRSRGGTVVQCQAVILTAHEQYDGLNVENNIIDAGSSAQGTCWSISYSDGGDPVATYFRRLTIRRNLIINGGTTSIGLAESPGAIVENNVIVAPIAGTFAINAPQFAHRVAQGDDVMNNATIRNNTIYLPSGPAISTPDTGVNEGTGFVIANNSVYYSGAGGNCFNTPLAAGAYTFVGNNACFGGAWGTTYDSTTHITSNPLFVNPPTDFHPGVGSPLIGAGNQTYNPGVDFLNRTRPNPPSIGAYEP